MKHCIIAGLHVVLDTGDERLLRLLAPRYAPFAVRAAEVAGLDAVCTLHEADALEALTGAEMELDFDCEGAAGHYALRGDEVELTLSTPPVGAGQPSGTVVGRLRTDTAYREGRVWLAGGDGHRAACWNSFLMMLFAFAVARHDGLLLHASVVEREGRGYLFLGPSGMGKSTHSSLWLRHVPGCSLVNDDNPAVRCVGGTVRVYGTPWSGKTPCYRNVSYPAGALVAIGHDTTNHIRRQGAVEAFATVLTASSGIRWDRPLYAAMCDTATCIVGQAPVYSLMCRPDREAAVVCSRGVGACDASTPVVDLVPAGPGRYPVLGL